jgi:hypothetical protein
MNWQPCLRGAYLCFVLLMPAILIAQQSKPTNDVAVAPEGHPGCNRANTGRSGQHQFAAESNTESCRQPDQHTHSEQQ